MTYWFCIGIITLMFRAAQDHTLIPDTIQTLYGEFSDKKYESNTTLLVWVTFSVMFLFFILVWPIVLLNVIINLFR